MVGDLKWRLGILPLGSCSASVVTKESVVADSRAASSFPLPLLIAVVQFPNSWLWKTGVIMLHQCSEHVVLLAQFVDIKWSGTGVREDLKSQRLSEESGSSFLPQVCRGSARLLFFFFFLLR